MRVLIWTLAARRSHREGVNNVRLLLFALGPSLRAAFRWESLLWFSLNSPLPGAGEGDRAAAFLFALFLRSSGAWAASVLCSRSAKANCCCKHAAAAAPRSWEPRDAAALLVWGCVSWTGPDQHSV